MISRDERQKQVFDKIIANKIDCYIDCCTGFGKTKVGGDILQWINGKYKDKNIFVEGNVIVPTYRVQEQWNKFIKYLNLSNVKLEVFVVNGIVKNNTNLSHKKISIYDEVHLLPLGKEFSKIFELTNTDYRLGLSGTLGKKHKDYLYGLKRPLKLADTVTIEEAEDNEWCAKTYTYNLMIDLNDKDKEIYDNLNQKFEQHAAYFGSDFDLIKDCQRIDKAKEYYYHIKDEYAGDFVNEYGVPLNESQSIKFLAQKAVFAMLYMRKRKEFIYENNSKIDVTAKLIDVFNKKFGNKVITFGQSIDACNQLYEQLTLTKQTKPIAFHSKMKSISVLQEVLLKHNLIDLEGKTMNLFKPIKVTGDKLSDLYISMFDKGEYDTICSAKALQVGFDSSGILCGIEVAGTSVKEDYNQRRGRSCRKEKIIYKGQEIYKIACYINIVLKDTKDESWTKSKQYGVRRVKRVNSIDEIINNFEQVLDSQLQ